LKLQEIEGKIQPDAKSAQLMNTMARNDVSISQQKLLDKFNSNANNSYEASVQISYHINAIKLTRKIEFMLRDLIAPIR
jgi:hypothetical protein